MNYTIFCAMCAAQIKVYETQVEVLNVAKRIIESKFNDKILNARLPKAIEGEVKRVHPDQNVIVRLDWNYYCNNVALTVYDGTNRAYRASSPDQNGYYTTRYVTDDTARVIIAIDKDTQRVNAPETVENITAMQLQLLNKVDEARHDIRRYDEARQAAAKLQSEIDNFRKRYSFRLRTYVPGCNRF